MPLSFFGVTLLLHEVVGMFIDVILYHSQANNNLDGVGVAIFSAHGVIESLCIIFNCRVMYQVQSVQSGMI